jgi:hypothetical protein
MLELILIVSVVVALALIMLGINIYIFGKKFPETEVGRNKNMMKLGLTCPSCEERARYRKLKPVKVNTSTLRPDWEHIKT